MSDLALGLGFALVASLALNGSYVIQHVGSAEAADVDARRPLHTLLSLLRSPAWAAGGHVTFSIFKGGHDWRVWRNQTPRMLVYANRWFGARR